MTPDEFWARVQVGEPDECWLWTNRRGEPVSFYGRFGAGGKHRAHRHALILSSGVTHIDKHALHTCDVPACCNPAHLYWGTDKDNVRDMVQRRRHAAWNSESWKSSVKRGRHGNHARGLASAAGKLDPDRSGEIASLLASGLRQKDVAARFGVTQSTISKFVRRTANG